MLHDASPRKPFHPAGRALAALGATLVLVPLTISAQGPPAPPRGVHGLQQHAAHGDPYVLLLAGKSTVTGGSTADVDKARKLRKSDNEELFWFEHGGKEYVIRDAATLQQIKALFEPQQKLANQQDALGEQQARLGSQQATLGAKQVEYGAKQGEIGGKMAKVAAEQAHLAGRGENSATLEAQMQELERQQQELKKPQEDLGRRQKELGQRQEALGKQQEELGRQQEEAAKEAEKQLKSLTGKAVASGLAQEVP